MSNPNPERNERLNQILNQIRERADLPSRWTPTWADVNFLLSLLDSQAAGANYGKLAHEILSEYNSADDPGLLREKVAEGFTTAANDAATRMRDRCVTKVREASAKIIACRPHSQIGDLMSKLLADLEQEE